LRFDLTATGTGLVLTDAQKAAFADAFHFTDAKAGAWSFDLSPADSAFLVPGDSDTIVETVTIDDGHGGTATQNETFTILGSNEAPTISSGGGGSAATYIINEDTRFITDVTATDPDRGDHVTYSILDANKKTPFTIDPQTGALSLKQGLDDEKTSTVTAEATDSYGASTGPTRVNRAVSTICQRLPICPEQRTSIDRLGWSGSCQKWFSRTLASKQPSPVSEMARKPGVLGIEIRFPGLAHDRVRRLASLHRRLESVILGNVCDVNERLEKHGPGLSHQRGRAFQLLLPFGFFIAVHRPQQ
jgi:VCBS repeat-containing protein